MNQNQTASASLHPPVIAGVPTGGESRGLFDALMKTYSEKLKDPRWEQFRQLVFSRKGNACETCGGDDKPAGDFNHVHHRRYISGREPWEYEIDDMSVLCRECHEEVHHAEGLFRDLIRRSPSWVAYHFAMFAEALSKIEEGNIPGVLGRAKCDARRIQYGGED